MRTSILLCSKAKANAESVNTVVFSAEDRLNSFLFGKAEALIGRRSSSFVKEQYPGIVCRHLSENIRTALLPMIFFSIYVYIFSSVICKIL